MAARITRAKKKIAAARIPYRVPPVEELPARIEAVLTVVYLMFTTGHTAPAGADAGAPRPGRAGRSTWPACCGVCSPTMPTSPACCALILLTDARRATRLDDAGQLVLLADQDRAQWDRAAIGEGDQPGPRCPARPATGALRPHGRHRRGARRGALLAGHRLGWRSSGSTTCW